MTEKGAISSELKNFKGGKGKGKGKGKGQGKGKQLAKNKKMWIKRRRSALMPFYKEIVFPFSRKRKTKEKELKGKKKSCSTRGQVEGEYSSGSESELEDGGEWMEMSKEEEEREEEQEGEGCTCNKILKIVFKDSLKFLPKSLDKLTKTLRNKAQFPQDCAECKDKNLLSVPLCTSCSSKKHPKEVFTNTYKYIQDNFGVQHLDSLLKKQVILEILRG